MSYRDTAFRCEVAICPLQSKFVQRKRPPQVRHTPRLVGAAETQASSDFDNLRPSFPKACPSSKSIFVRIDMLCNGRSRDAIPYGYSCCWRAHFNKSPSCNLSGAKKGTGAIKWPGPARATTDHTQPDGNLQLRLLSVLWDPLAAAAPLWPFPLEVVAAEWYGRLSGISLKDTAEQILANRAQKTATAF